MKDNTAQQNIPSQFITEEIYKRNKELIAERRRIEQLLLNISDAVFVVNKKYKITLANIVAKTIFPTLQPDSKEKKDIQDVLKLTNEKTNDLLDIKKYCFSDKEKEIIYDVCYTYEKDEKKYFILKTSTINYDDNNSECLITLSDITKQKFSEKAKDDFLSVAAHELRTPLTIIKSYLWRLISKDGGNLSTDQKTNVNRIQFATERLINLVNDILNISRFEQGRLVFEISKYDAQDILKQATAGLEIKAQDNNIYLKMDTSKVKDTNVYVDKDKLVEIMFNIVGNALKFTKQGGITIHAEKEDTDFIKVSIVDTGVGIDKKDMSSLFKKFGRLDNSYTTVAESGGTGLGLFIVKMYVEHMGGKIGAFSEGLGKGSTFWFTLPTKPIKGMSDKASTNTIAPSGSKLNAFKTTGIISKKDYEKSKVNTIA